MRPRCCWLLTRTEGSGGAGLAVTPRLGKRHPRSSGCRRRHRANRVSAVAAYVDALTPSTQIPSALRSRTPCRPALLLACDKARRTPSASKSCANYAWNERTGRCHRRAILQLRAADRPGAIGWRNLLTHKLRSRELSRATAACRDYRRLFRRELASKSGPWDTAPPIASPFLTTLCEAA
jgi:hypothetical protein